MTTNDGIYDRCIEKMVYRFVRLGAYVTTDPRFT